MAQPEAIHGGKLVGETILVSAGPGKVEVTFASVAWRLPSRDSAWRLGAIEDQVPNSATPRVPRVPECPEVSAIRQWGRNGTVRATFRGPSAELC